MNFKELVKGQVSMPALLDDRLSFLEHRRKFSKWNTAARLALIALFIGIVIIVLVNFHVSELQAFINWNRNLSFAISLLIIFLSGVTFVPTIPLTVFISVLLGPVPATIITTLGTTLAALVHYQVGKQIGDVVNFEEKKAGLPFKLGKLPVNSPLFLLAGRVVPGGPIGLSFVCGAYCVPYSLYLWTTFITNLLGSALVAYGGDVLIKF